MTRLLFAGAFALGAAATLWIGQIFFAAGDTLGMIITLLIALVYAIGALELRHFRRATATLDRALQTLSQPVDKLCEWLPELDPSLQNSVRLRIEGERNGLPAPVLTPYLVGLLVMLGLLGTFVGMVGTLKGAVLALQGSTELEAIRAGLTAPIEGLGLAFGTSVAGVAASAMLGLLSTLSRRERLRASHRLDTSIGSQLRQFSRSHQQQQAYQAIQHQAESLPAVAAQLSSLANHLETMGERIGEQLLANQNSFQGTVTDLYRELSESVDASLKQSLAESGKLASASIAPMVEQTMAQIDARALSSQAQQQATSEQQLAQVSQHLEDNNQLLRERFESSQAQQSESSATLLDSVSRASDSIAPLVEQTMAKISAHALSSQEQLQANTEQQLAQVSQHLQSNNQLLRESLTSSLEQQSSSTATLLEGVSRASDSIAPLVEQTMAQLSQSCETTQQQVSEQLAAHQQQLSQHLQANLEQQNTSTSTLVASFGETSELWSKQQQQQAEQLSETLQASLQQLRSDENQRGDAAVARLGELEQGVVTHLASLGQALEAPMTRLIETASETPKAAAEVIDKLRLEMSKNIERDNDLLAERTRLMQQLDSLAQTMEQSSAGQREAIDQLISRSADTLAQVGTQFGERLEGEASKLAEVADHFTASSQDVASLGESFGIAVQQFSDSNTQLMENLTRIETSLQASNNRSDEQLSYYVAQAREIIDHNLLSHKEILDALQLENSNQNNNQIKETDTPQQQSLIEGVSE